VEGLGHTGLGAFAREVAASFPSGYDCKVQSVEKDTAVEDLGGSYSVYTYWCCCIQVGSGVERLAGIALGVSQRHRVRVVQRGLVPNVPELAPPAPFAYLGLRLVAAAVYLAQVIG
jgi:hypothetical protein